MKANPVVKKVLMIILSVTVLSSCFSLTAYADDSLTSKDRLEYYVIPYVIEKGDTLAHVYWLWGLKYENYAEDIKSLNNVNNLDLLYVGATYLLPTTAPNVKTENYTKVMSHEMKSGETVYEVCSEYNIDYTAKESLMRRYNNGADLTKVGIGDKLLIPLV